MALIEIQVPDIGSTDEVSVIEVMVQVGDTIKAEQSLITVESDKASMEIPSSHAGVVKELRVKLGDQVKEGSLLLLLETEGVAESAPNTAPALAEQAPTAIKTEVAETAVTPAATAAVPAAAPAAASGPVELRVPDMGDFKDVTVIEVLVKAGDTVALEQSLFTIESDKASMEIPSPAAGVIHSLSVKVGDTVNIGDLVGQMDGVASAAAAAPAAAPVAAPAAASAPVAAAPVAAPAPVAAAPAAAVPAAVPAHNPTAAPTGRLPHASPSVRKFARELGVPLAEVKGSGHKGRITQTDVQSFTQSVMTGSVQTQAQAAKAPAVGSGGTSGSGNGLEVLAWPKVDFAKFGAVERKDLSRIKKISGANLHRNWVMIPHVTNNDEADITDLEAFRVSTNKANEKSGVKVTMLAFVIKAVVSALQKFPEFNASLDGDTLVYKKYFNIGFAADTPNGLVVPVLKDADKKGLLQISQEMGELAQKARDGKMGAADMQGGCMSISSLGGIGGTHFTPIINAPEVAILGLSKGQMKPLWDGKQFVPRLMLPLSLSYDHRVIDGALAARFNAYLGLVLADYRRILL